LALMQYAAFVFRAPGGDYAVTFPDVPGAVAQESTLDEALQTASRVLGWHADQAAQDGEPFPKARPLDEILADPVVREDLAADPATIAYVPLIRDLGTARRVNISLDGGLLEALDDEARRRGVTRSALIATALQREIAADPDPGAAGRRARRRALRELDRAQAARTPDEQDAPGRAPPRRVRRLVRERSHE
jgi:predicted RNase H-like HicB family nuclease